LTLEHDAETCEPVFRNIMLKQQDVAGFSRPPFALSTNAFPAADAGEVLGRAAVALTGKKDV
jgi:hypothetical protein